ncbi:MAG: hypothetical protein NDI94_06590 [Candidatus Woesearchaeota archaeon]|nr:hypothetical protein [Candidatus Woesearchaeota archaeon]
MPTLEDKTKKALNIFKHVHGLMNDVSIMEDGREYLPQALDAYQMLYACHIEGTYFPQVEDGVTVDVEILKGDAATIPYLRHIAIALGYISGMALPYFNEDIFPSWQSEFEKLKSDYPSFHNIILQAHAELPISNGRIKVYNAFAHVNYGFGLYHFGTDPAYAKDFVEGFDIFELLHGINPAAF